MLCWVGSTFFLSPYYPTWARLGFGLPPFLYLGLGFFYLDLDGPNLGRGLGMSGLCFVGWKGRGSGDVSRVYEPGGDGWLSSGGGVFCCTSHGRHGLL